MSLGLCDSECKFALSCPLKEGREQIFTLIHGNLESQIPSLFIRCATCSCPVQMLIVDSVSSVAFFYDVEECYLHDLKMGRIFILKSCSVWVRTFVFDSLSCCQLQYSAKRWRLGCVSMPPAARGSQDAESRNLVFPIQLSTVLSFRNIGFLFSAELEDNGRIRWLWPNYKLVQYFAKGWKLGCLSRPPQAEDARAQYHAT